MIRDAWQWFDALMEKKQPGHSRFQLKSLIRDAIIDCQGLYITVFP